MTSWTRSTGPAIRAARFAPASNHGRYTATVMAFDQWCFVVVVAAVVIVVGIAFGIV
jgi:hypothetical protein